MTSAPITMGGTDNSKTQWWVGQGAHQETLKEFGSHITVTSPSAKPLRINI